MRPNTTQQNHWAQVGIGAGALLLPPLALGAALYSMLAAPEESPPHRGGGVAGSPVIAPASQRAAGADEQPPAIQPAKITDAPAESRIAVPAPHAGMDAGSKSAEEVARIWEQVPVRSMPVQIAPAPIAPAAAAAAATAPPPVEVESPAAGRPDAESPPAPSAPPQKRAVHRSAQRQQQQSQQAYPLKNWLQQIGILPRNTRG
jgi:hypothetical protein